jgi:excisionase family DNA binding protein
MMAQVEAAAPLLDVNEVARRLGTEPRFVRRLIAERRIEFHKLGRHVRILRKAGVMTGYHTRWVRPSEEAEDPERVAIREALAFGKAVYDQRRTLGLSVAELAERAGMTADEIECIEEGGTEPTIALLRRLAAALDAEVHLTAGHDLGSVWFEPHAPDLLVSAV